MRSFTFILWLAGLLALGPAAMQRPGQAEAVLQSASAERETDLAPFALPNQEPLRCVAWTDARPH